MERKSRELNRKLECEGPECHRVIQYRDKLFAEEAKTGNSKSSGDVRKKGAARSE